MSSDHKTVEVELSALGEPAKRHVYNDEADMRRMGKHQAFQVRLSPSHLSGGLEHELRHWPAKLPIPLDRSFLRRCHCWLVLCSKVSHGRPLQKQHNRQGAKADINSSTSTIALANGGTGGLIIIYLVNWAGLTFVVLSLAEMSSM